MASFNLNKMLAGTPLAGQGPAFRRAAAPYGLDPRILVGIAMQESSLGRQQFAKNNPFGYNVHRSAGAPGPEFPSYEAAASAVARTLAGPLYKGRGKTTLAQIIPTYAPAGDGGNNPAHYISRVASFLGIDPNANVFGKPGAAVPTAPAPARGGVPSPASPQAGASVAQTSSSLLNFGKAYAIIQANMRDALAGKMPPQSRFDQLGKLITSAMMSIPTAQVTPENTTPAKPQASANLGPVGGALYGGVLGKRGSLIGTPYTGTHTLGNWESDDAVDIAVPVGTPVYAPRAGVIGSQFGSLGSSGRFQGIRLHLQIPGNELYYAHLSKTAPGIKPGVRVKAGQLLGYTGSANGVAHLHLGIRKGDPRKVLGL